MKAVNGSRAAAKARAAVDIASFDDRPAQLLAIARKLFASKGYDNTSLRDIAEVAKVTKAALYYHFPNKDALYEQVVIESMQGLLDAVQAAVAAATTPTDRVRAFMAASARFLDEKRDQWIAGSNAFWQGSDGERRAAAIDLRDAYEQLLRGCVEAGIASGEFRAVDAPLATRMLLSSLNQVARWHQPGGRLTVLDVAAQYVDMTLFGIVALAPPAAARKPKRG